MRPEAGAALPVRVWPLEPAVRLPRGARAPEVLFAANALAGVEAEAALSPTCEVGGILVGGVEVLGAEWRVRVEGFVPAADVESGPAHLVFKHESWRGVRERRRREHPDRLVVGWYHTHPGFGVFLSETDRALHASIFREEPWCVALVLDPLSGSRGFFWPEAGHEARCAESVLPCGDRRRAVAGAGGGENVDGIPDAED